MRFAFGGTSDIFMGTFDGRPVAIKVPGVRCVCDVTYPIYASMYASIYSIRLSRCACYNYSWQYLHDPHRGNGLKVDETTACLIQEVLKELKVTKDCSHPHVVHVLGLMVGPGRIG